ncbi:MAG: glycosyltransferase family 2 protein [Nitriliruptoraceae bacterium]|nr:glycosyltransferase family 2 protein [Nitriliruptoraceae bacterium]
MASPMYSVIVPTFGRPEYLGEAIESVLAQTLGDFEVIVVDDASPGPVTLPVADPRVRLIRAEENGGPGAARNLGVQHALGQRLAFLDDDDLWLPRRLELARAGLERASLTICWQNPDGRVLEGMVADHILDAEPPQIGAVALERTAWVDMDGSFRRGQDVVWWLQIAPTVSVSTVPEQGLTIRSRPDKLSQQETLRRLEASHRILDEFAPYFAAHDRARARRWQKIARWESRLGNRQAAMRAYLRSLRAEWNPAVAKMAWRATLRPGTASPQA